ncbi:DedD protein [Andreprevotia lacus DSM 23236]|jgi:DedD protein|uniref:DedD protein n=1 Tax=Andreprevotia lacus DSM 23236 TaxID=1121001 RepID=A0A1W1XIQ6_9NEIS|nr:SPOR domain-containing protein [Andreprevotia lacus]SMC23654.1 DedD protein [Andreprevotia lacus DSM 23236]
MARDNVSEELLQLRKRARRRLIGAVTLVIFSLIVLWTVLDGEPPATMTHPVEIIASAPGASTPAATGISNTATEATTGAHAASPVQAVAEPTVVPSLAPVSLPGKLVNSQVETPAQPSPKPVVKPEPHAVEKPVEKPAEKPTDKPKPNKPAKDPQKILDGLDDAEAKPAERQTEKPAATAHAGQTLVQIGAYGDKAKVNEILGKLKANGIAAYAEPVANKGVALTRIRIAAGDDAHAKQVMQKAAKLGYAPQLVH